MEATDEKMLRIIRDRTDEAIELAQRCLELEKENVELRAELRRLKGEQ